MKQYEGIKHIDDQHDAFFLAQMLILGILPEGYIYPKKDRPVRDLARKRLFLVQHKTSHILSLHSLFVLRFIPHSAFRLPHSLFVLRKHLKLKMSMAPSLTKKMMNLNTKN